MPPAATARTRFNFAAGAASRFSRFEIVTQQQETRCRPSRSAPHPGRYRTDEFAGILRIQNERRKERSPESPPTVAVGDHQAVVEILYPAISLPIHSAVC